MANSKQEIYAYLSKVLQEQFEVEPEQIHEGAALYDELDIDSIDAINLIIALKPLTKTKVSVENFHEIKTVGDVVNKIHAFLLDAEKADGQQPGA